MIKRDSNRVLWIAFCLALVLNAGGLLYLYLDEDLRNQTYRYVEKERVDEKGKPLRKKRELDEKTREQVKERAEKRKKAEMRKEIEKLEELKREAEDFLDEKIQDMLAEKDLELEDLLSELNREAAELLEDVRAERAIVEFKDGRAEAVEGRLEAMVEMDVYEQAQAFIRNAEESAERLGDASPELVRSEKEGEVFDPFADDAFTEKNLPEKDLEKLGALSERARELADKARRLREGLYQELFQAGAPLEQLQPEDIEALEPNELYEYAQTLEEAIHADVTAHQAADLAMVNEGEFAEAHEAVDGGLPERPDMSEALARNNPGNTEQLLAYNQALEEALGETANMRVASQSRMRNVQSRSSVGEQGRQITMARQGMQAAAARQGSRGYADYSQTMRRMDATMRMQGSGVNQGTDGPENRTADFGTGAGMAEGGKKPDGLSLPSNRIMREALPGRRFTSGGERQGWLYLDSWYIIGPWEKQGGQITFENVHPPEALVDLDAEYLGKEVRGQRVKLRWRFLQSDSVRITPYEHTANSVYYAYTEVYAEEPMDALLAVASDDGAKMWLNDVVVHQDSGLSSWRMDEGFRKVFLKQGFNRILLRVENGPAVCHFSVLLCPVDMAEQS